MVPNNCSGSSINLPFMVPPLWSPPCLHNNGADAEIYGAIYGTIYPTIHGTINGTIIIVAERMYGIIYPTIYGTNYGTINGTITGTLINNRSRRMVDYSGTIIELQTM